MKNEIFRGTATALITPFKGEQIDYEKLGELIEEQIHAGIDAIVIAGTTGEASTMPDHEHIELIKQSVVYAGKRVPIIAGTGSNDTIHGINLSKEAQRVGADALLHVTPYYNKTSQNGLVEHFKATAISVDLPIILYNVPSRTGLNISPHTYYELAGISNIVAVKECNISQMAETILLCGEAYDHYSGEDGLIVPLLSLGGKGVISVVSNLVPKQIKAITNLWFEGDLKESAKLQIQLMELINSCFIDINPIPVKAAMNLMGKAVGQTRLPLVDLAAVHQAKLAAVLAKYDLAAVELG